MAVQIVAFGRTNTIAPAVISPRSPGATMVVGMRPFAFLLRNLSGLQRTVSSAEHRRTIVTLRYFAPIGEVLSL